MSERIVVCGGRLGTREEAVFKVLDYMFERDWDQTVEIIEGNAFGVDRAAGAWARRKGLTHTKFPINDEVDGSDEQAPKRRNIRMFEHGKPTICVGFPGGPGTRHMLDLCHRADVRCFDVEFGVNLLNGFTVFEWPPMKRRRTT